MYTAGLRGSTLVLQRPVFDRLSCGKTRKWNPPDHRLGPGANIIGRERVGAMFSGLMWLNGKPRVPSVCSCEQPPVGMAGRGDLTIWPFSLPVQP